MLIFSDFLCLPAFLYLRVRWLSIFSTVLGAFAPQESRTQFSDGLSISSNFLVPFTPQESRTQFQMGSLAVVL